MTTPFSDWLGSLARAQKGPVSPEPATRGQYYEMSIVIDGDYTTATLTGSIRSAPDSDTALAVFNVGAASFSGGKTTWVCSLGEGDGANATGSLPEDSAGDGTVFLPYDFLLKISGGSAERLFGGLFEVSGHITEPV